MSGTNHAALAAEAKKIRASLGFTQEMAALACGIPLGSMAHLESGKDANVSLDYLQTYVEMLRTTPRAELLKALYDTKKFEPDERGTPRRTYALPAISREMRAFMKRHDMSYEDLSAVIKKSRHWTQRAATNVISLDEEQVGSIRRAMAAYEGSEKTTKRYVPSDKKEEPAKREAPKKEEPKKEEPSAGSVDLIVKTGVRLNNGDNIAPHLVLDGKTMHVFTLVPGGVFVSYVEGKVK